jgi:Right handed beta helix region
MHQPAMRTSSSVAPLLVAALSLWAAPAAHAATRTVGPGKTYAQPCAAIAAAQDGDVIEIDAGGNYAGDVCAVTRNNLTLRGVGGRAHIDAAGKAYGGKGTWVISGANTTVENIELSGAKVPDLNGAGIRQEGAGLTVRNCFFHDNEDGILSGGNGEILIEGSEFARNGAGDGYSHNMYIGHEKKFTLRWSYSHHSKIGHLVKSRAEENYILYNRLMDEADGTSSYTINLPNGGTSFLIGNLIQQGPSTDNAAIVAYAEEGATNAKADLYVVNNTFVNDRGSGTFLQIAAASAPVVVRNNIFLGGGTVINQASAVMAANFQTGDPMLVDRAGFDYHLKAGSPCINAGMDPGVAGAMALMPQFQYVHPVQREARVSVGVIDIGAYELGGGAPAPDAGTGADAAGGGGAGSTGSAGTAGTTGAAGSTGTAGTTGAAGSAGTAGTTGAAGSVGRGGTTGAAGSAGTAGTTGAAGRAGTAGTTGAAGKAGAGATSSGGCSCRIAARDPVAALGSIFLALALAIARSSRRRR